MSVPVALAICLSERKKPIVIVPLLSSVPAGTNLYGNHPIYFEHRTTGTHGVFLLNSNGMDIKINQENAHTTLEYNVIGGILDLYFLAGAQSPPLLTRWFSLFA